MRFDDNGLDDMGLKIEMYLKYWMKLKVSCYVWLYKDKEVRNCYNLGICLKGNNKPGEIVRRLNQGFGVEGFEYTPKWGWDYRCNMTRKDLRILDTSFRMLGVTKWGKINS